MPSRDAHRDSRERPCAQARCCVTPMPWAMLARCRGHRLSCSSVLKLTSTAAVLTELGPGKSFGKPRIGQLRYSRASAAKATAYSSPAKSLDIKTGRSYLPDSFSTHPLGVLTAWTGGGRDRLSAREEAHEIPSAA